MSDKMKTIPLMQKYIVILVVDFMDPSPSLQKIVMRTFNQTQTGPSGKPPYEALVCNLRLWGGPEV